MHRSFLHLLIIWITFWPFSVSAEQPSRAAIATAHPLATQSGMEILEQGGNAFDAAVAITAVLAVVEPYSSGLGGGGLWLLHRATDGKQVMIDGRETAPGSASAMLYLEKNGEVKKELSLNGPLAAGIPGVPAGLVYLNEHYGRMMLAQNLAPAIRYAREGFQVTELYRKLAGFRLDVLRASKDAAAIFLHENEVPPSGHLIVQKDLANSLIRISEHGAPGFYIGELANRLIDDVRKNGGVWRSDDLAGYKIVERQPIITQYRDIRVISAPPPSSGGIVLGQALNILQNFNLERLDNITRKHVIIEAMRRAFRDRAAYLGDSDFIEIPVERLLDQDYSEGLAASIELDRSTSSEELGVFPVAEQTGTHTTHFSILDTEGNRVAATLSINLPFGSGFVPSGTGVLLNDEMDDFAIKPMQPNAYGLVGDEANRIEPRKRPLSSMTPTFLETGDHVAILGTSGGSRIISTVLLGVLDFADGNLPKSWVSIPRYHHQYLPDEVQFEQNGLTAIEQAGLRELGHTLSEKDRAYGNMQAILWWKKKNLVYAASDPRGEGEAVTSAIRPHR
ncbi:MAG: gamma-glutamyltransferase [Gammaproteobacteria bacterium]|nr:gamma-glutamyltransferase [Gammaproteobacteria bacterium]